MSNSDLLLNDTVDTLANGAVVGAFLFGAVGLFTDRDIAKLAATGGVYGAFAGIAMALAKAVSS